MLEMILRRHLARDASGRHAKDTHAAHRHRGGRRLEPGLTLLVEPAQAANRLGRALGRGNARRLLPGAIPDIRHCQPTSSQGVGMYKRPSAYLLAGDRKSVV